VPKWCDYWCNLCLRWSNFGKMWNKAGKLQEYTSSLFLIDLMRGLSGPRGGGGLFFWFLQKRTEAFVSHYSIYNGGLCPMFGLMASERLEEYALTWQDFWNSQIIWLSWVSGMRMVGADRPIQSMWRYLENCAKPKMRRSKIWVKLASDTCETFEKLRLYFGWNSSDRSLIWAHQKSKWPII